jgi:ABC-type nitrate/sulfonate/bicarbonate transport system ATPase subunit
MADKLVVENISKSHIETGPPEKTIEVLKEISFSLAPDEIVSVIGPTGCGKTTLLKIIDGLVKPNSGRVTLDGKAIQNPLQSGCAMVFQNFNLFPWRNVQRNVEFGPEAKGVPKEERAKTARHYIELVGLKGFERYHPHQLSGGMQQRVGLARALAVNPEVILLDEPFSAIDILLRESLQVEVMKILIASKKSAIFVTHDAEEALFLSDRIISFSTKPAKVKKVYNVNLPRPRGKSESEDKELFQERRRLIESRSDEAYRLISGMKADLYETAQEHIEKVA